jgi:hypothetical protein
VPNNARTTRWSYTVSAVVMALLGVSILVANTVEVVQGDRRISELRAHGRLVPGVASIAWACSSGRGGGCSPGTVELDFHDAHGIPQLTWEATLAHTLYVPSGPADDDGGVRTTVVYDPANPDDAQAAGVLHWGALDLVEHRWLPFTIGLVLGVAGPAALLSNRAPAVRVSAAVDRQGDRRRRRRRLSRSRGGSYAGTGRPGLRRRRVR